VTERARLAYEAWKAADGQAREYEQRLARQWEAHNEGGEPPTAELIREVARWRAVANDKLTAAMMTLSIKNRDDTNPGR
jgi:hypothetical protein